MSEPQTMVGAETETAAGAGAGPGGPKSWAKRALGSPALRVGFLLCAVGLAVFAIVDDWKDVKSGFGRLGVLTVLAAFAAVFAAMLATLQMWRALMSSFGSPLPFRFAARVFFVGQLGKYVPGSVWPVVVQAELGRQYRVPRARSAVVAVLTMLAALASGLLAAAATLPFLAGRETAGYRWAFLCTPVILVCLHPRVVNRAVGLILRLARREPLERPIAGRAIAFAIGWGLLSWAFFGLQIWVMAVRLGAPSGRTFLLAIGAFALAWSAGFLFVIAPAGAGVRDLALAAALGPVLASGQTTVIVLLSRIVMTIADLLFAAVCFRLGGHPEPDAPSPRGSDVP